ncbi:fungal-specific transcription factor domain-containing protein [Ilyonectria robusta]|uniref:fungal-specific transcription factor domain-containing protein n=1 Tax=Ilyonectria robusta TaxID=1079257 RepID=UPI001E8E1A59|nr:fungal-specific transcription factor domain-containing protein [Ilyonectria robusta]KAH8734650.1 fungal-specific transcription factor domain-containing protein [Ilyonectria robusta]
MTSYLESLAMTYDFNNMTNGADPAAHHNDSSPSATHQEGTPTPSQTSRSSGNVTVYQTTGPDAHTGPIPAAGGSGAPAINPRSCVTCRRRKVRCDKQMPCSNCRRAQIPCVFPAPGRAPRQPRPRDPNAPPKNSSQREVELVKRLRKLEGIVEELSGQIEVESAGKGPSSASSPDVVHNNALAAGSDRSTTFPPRQASSANMFGCHSGSPKENEPAGDVNDAAQKKELQKKFGRLVLNEQSGGRRYVSSGFWAKLNDELDSIRQDTQKLTDEESDESDYEATPDFSPASAPSVDHHAFILGYRSADVNLAKCYPLPSHVPFLWSVYQENVEPLVKLVHVPTTEELFRNVRRNQSQLTPGQECLVFAIYYAAINSLDADEVQTNLGATKEEILIQYRFAVEQALAKANFLHASDFMVMQAFTIFLVVVRCEDDSRFCWSLTGLVIHLARGMGLHRDGTHFGLSPFETEMRRRVWWQLLILDLRSVDELGTDLAISDRAFDTKMPSNINDADISPESTEFPEPRESRSDSAISLVRYEICALSRRLVMASSALASLCPRGMALNGTSLPDRERMLIEVYQGVETKFLKHVVIHETDPLYWMAAMIARVIMAKMCLVIYQPMLFPGSDAELTDEARHRVYVAAIEMMEYSHILNTDPRCKQYKWIFMTYTSWHAMAYYLVESCRRPWTALVERGWQALHGYGSPTQLPKNEDHAAMILPLRKLSLKATKHRASEIARLKADPEEASRLDFEERMNPTHARFGTAPGAEGKMEKIRDAWRVMVRPEGPAPWVSSTSQDTTTSPTMSRRDLSQPRPGPQVNSPPQTPSGKDVPSSIELSDAAMNLMTDIMNQDVAMPLTAFWPLNDLGNHEMKNTPQNTNSGSAPGPTPQMQNNTLGQQMPQQMPHPMQLPKDDNLPPYLWSDPFTSMNATFGDMGGEDTDMLGEEFNWQDWSQSIRGLEMESNQTQKKW